MDVTNENTVLPKRWVLHWYPKVHWRVFFQGQIQFNDISLLRVINHDVQNVEFDELHTQLSSSEQIKGMLALYDKKYVRPDRRQLDADEMVDYAADPRYKTSIVSLADSKSFIQSNAIVAISNVLTWIFYERRLKHFNLAHGYLKRLMSNIPHVDAEITTSLVGVSLVYHAFCSTTMPVHYTAHTAYQLYFR